jgi:hypothetical protein
MIPNVETDEQQSFRFGTEWFCRLAGIRWAVDDNLIRERFGFAANQSQFGTET